MGFLRERRAASRRIARARQEIDAGAYGDKRAPRPDRLDRLARQGCVNDNWIWPPLGEPKPRIKRWWWWAIAGGAWLIAGGLWLAT